jgi:hypothetical protein
MESFFFEISSYPKKNMEEGKKIVRELSKELIRL